VTRASARHPHADDAPSRAGAWREARTLAWRHRRTLGAAFALVIVNRASAFAIPLGSRYLVDDVIVRKQGAMLLPIAALTAAALVVQCASGYAVSQVVGIGAQRAITTLRLSLHAHVLRLPMDFFERSQTGALVARVMGDAEQLRVVVGSGMVQLVSGALSACFASALLFALDTPLTLAILLVLASYTVGATRGIGWLHSAFHLVSVGTAELTGRLTESLGGVRVVKAYAAERQETSAFARRSHALLRDTVRAIGGVSLLGASATLATGAVSLLILVVGGRAVLSGAMTLGDLVMYVFLVGLLSAPLLQIAAIAGELGKALAGLGRIHQLLSLETEAASDLVRAARPVPRLSGKVQLMGVSYAYESGASLVLRDVDLLAPAGTTTALVGRSGSGKSTLCRLLLAYDRPTSGRVLVDGCDLASLRRGDYRRHLGVVPQEGFLFHASVADNIRYARSAASFADVKAAGRAACCDEFVERLPNGYDTIIGERGATLSGGQRQRIAIARALLADPRILILDEATSSLDSESEALIQRALAALALGRTTFVIAHRMSTIERADQILVLDGGRVVERGTHEELLAHGPVYWSLRGEHVATVRPWKRQVAR
jgi:ABC-type multidrug transport system fused ATPase/permease subunit